MIWNNSNKFPGRNIIFPLFHYSPYYIRHLLLLPYRKNVLEVTYTVTENGRKQKRYLSALYDSILNIALEGYVAIMEEKIIPSTGQMLHYLFDLTIRFDEFLDRNRKTEISLRLSDVLGDPSIKEQLSVFRNYVRMFGREEIIVTYFKEMFTAHYDRYINLIKTNSTRVSFNKTLEISQLDSGSSLASAMEIVRLFNDHQSNSKMFKEFYLLGTVGKFADDIADLVCDIKKNHLNLFCSLINEDPIEKINLYQGIKSNVQTDINWLRKNCPNTFAEYFRTMESYYNQITDPKLKLICELSIIPAFFGFTADPEHNDKS